MATRPECTPGRIYVPRWVQLAVLPVLLIVAWFTLGAIAQVIFIFLCLLYTSPSPRDS